MRGARRRDAEAIGDLGDRLRRVTREHLDRHPLLEEVAHGCRRVRAQLLRQDDQRHGLEGGWQRGRLDGFHSAGEDQDPPGGPLVLPGSGHDAGLVLGEDDLGSPENPRTMVEEAHGAPLARGREGHLRPDPPAHRPARSKRCEGADRRVGRRVGLCGGRQDLFDVGSWQVGEHLDVRELQPWFGERPGLVDAQHVDACQSLHCGKLLDQHAMACQLECPDRERHRRQQHQSLGHHGGDPGDRSPQGVGR